MQRLVYSAAAAEGDEVCRWTQFRKRQHVSDSELSEQLGRDIQNLADPNALLLRTADPLSLVGYCPRYLASEFSEFIKLWAQQISTLRSSS
jgi:hypothetical protein